MSLRCELRVRSVTSFILSHEADIAMNVGTDKGCELTLQYSPFDEDDTFAAFLLCQILLTGPRELAGVPHRTLLAILPGLHREAIVGTF